MADISLVCVCMEVLFPLTTAPIYICIPLEMTATTHVNLAIKLIINILVFSNDLVGCRIILSCRLLTFQTEGQRYKIQ